MYDNECSFCYRITRFFKTFDMFDKIQWVDKDWEGFFPDEGRAKIQDTVVVFNPSNNKLYYKSVAVSKIISCIPFGVLFFWILRLPVLSIFFDMIYDWFSRNRKKFCSRKD
jgi:predicted DCC family thiol-disulfide oxidoreductase YuxK